MLIGVDFDNTLADYQEAFLACARERGWVGPDYAGQKRALRDLLRLRPEGDLCWQDLQGEVYGPGIGRAVLYPGAADVVRRLRSSGHGVVIVSHKTEFAGRDPTRTPLRQAALGWMTGQSFFEAEGMSLAVSDVHFCATRAEKLAKIDDLRCALFIDDLEEVLLDPGFPASIRRVLFRPDGEAHGDPSIATCRSWAEVGDLLIDADA